LWIGVPGISRYPKVTHALILGCTTTDYLISTWANSTLITLFSEMLKFSKNYFPFQKYYFPEGK
jgi:hypothetical protein